ALPQMRFIRYQTNALRATRSTFNSERRAQRSRPTSEPSQRVGQHVPPRSTEAKVCLNLLILNSQFLLRGARPRRSDHRHVGLDFGVVVHTGEAEAEQLQELDAIAGDVGGL